MSEKLIIRKFGPIESVELDLKKINVLIGEQASGKSTVAKILAFCRYFTFIVHDGSFVPGLDEWGLAGYLRTLESYIYYENEDYSFEFDGKKGESGVRTLKPKSQKFKELIKEYENLIKHHEIPLNLPPSFFQNYVSETMNNPFYLPTERGLQSIFSLGRSSLQNISDSLFNQFAKLDMIIRKFTEETAIEPLGLSYKNEGGKSFFRSVDKRQEQFFQLNQGASGYQSTIPIVLLVKFYSEKRKKGKYFIIEEPELNLFPKAQKNLMEFLIQQVNTNKHSLLLNTHSPYVLSALDNMMYAYKVGKMNNGVLTDKVEEVLKQDAWLNPKDVSVYKLERGKAQLILNRKEAIIDKEYLDQVSNVMGDQIDQLLNIELNPEN